MRTADYATIKFSDLRPSYIYTDWCENNIGHQNVNWSLTFILDDQNTYRLGVFEFASAEDATLFRLIWL
ncbi:MAG TPA: hypothetical protein VFM18_17410 [Methanosarcina sp.]|nr:hypothetical protein [Methanosarcina sp.]